MNAKIGILLLETNTNPDAEDNVFDIRNKHYANNFKIQNFVTFSLHLLLLLKLPLCSTK
jgi:hypothetical protein